MKEFFTLGSFDFEKIAEDFSDSGATSFKILAEDFRMSLLKEALRYSYRPEAEIVGSGDRIVRQQLGSFEDFPDNSQFILLKNSFQALLDESVAQSGIRPFQTRLNFNSMVLQKYARGSLGITPHRDHLRYINLVSIFVIGGRGQFYLCADRSGKDAKEIDASPGNVILLKALGFLGSRDRLFYYITDIQETRYTFGLRQEQGMIRERTLGSDAPTTTDMKVGTREVSGQCWDQSYRMIPLFRAPRLP